MDERAFDELASRVTEAGVIGRPENELMAGFCRRNVDAGVPLARAMVILDTLHPIYEGRALRWRADEPEVAEAVARQSVRLEHVLEQAAAEERPWSKRAQPEHIGKVGQIGPDVDPRQLAYIHVDDLNATAAQRAKHLAVDPRLYRLAHRSRVAAEVEQRRQSFGLERVERAAEPASLGFEHRGLERSPGNAPRCPNPASLRKSDLCRRKECGNRARWSARSKTCWRPPQLSPVEGGNRVSGRIVAGTS